MDKLDRYRDIIESCLRERTLIPYSYGEISTEPVFDRTNDRYLLVNVGWEGHRRVHGSLVHIDIIDGKVWIQRDGIEDGIANDFAVCTWLATFGLSTQDASSGGLAAIHA